MIPTGRFTKKIDCQPNAPTSTPPIVGPRVVPVATTVPLIPSARPRSLPGKTALVIANPFDCNIAAPIAWPTRAAIRKVGVGARPQASEPRVKTPKPIV